MKRVLAFQVFNQKGANTVIKLWLQGDSDPHSVQYRNSRPSQISHFAAALIMLQNGEVFFKKSNDTFAIAQKKMTTDSTITFDQNFLS